MRFEPWWQLRSIAPLFFIMFIILFIAIFLLTVTVTFRRNYPIYVFQKKERKWEMNSLYWFSSCLFSCPESVWASETAQTRQDSPNRALRHTRPTRFETLRAWNKIPFAQSLRQAQNHISQLISVQTILPPWTSHFKSTLVLSHLSPHILWPNPNFQWSRWTLLLKPRHKINFNWIAIHPRAVSAQTPISFFTKGRLIFHKKWFQVCNNRAFVPTKNPGNHDIFWDGYHTVKT